MKKVMKNVDIESNSKNTEKTHQKKKSQSPKKRKRLVKKLKKKRVVNLMMKTLEATVEVDLPLILTQTHKVIKVRRVLLRKCQKRSISKIKMSLQVVDRHLMILVLVAVLIPTLMMMVKKYQMMMKMMKNFKLKERFQQNINSC